MHIICTKFNSVPSCSFFMGKLNINAILLPKFRAPLYPPMQKFYNLVCIYGKFRELTHSNFIHNHTSRDSAIFRLFIIFIKFTVRALKIMSRRMFNQKSSRHLCFCTFLSKNYNFNLRWVWVGVCRSATLTPMMHHKLHSPTA